MWSSPLFWRLFISYAALNLAATATFVVIVSGWQEEQVVEQVKQRLNDSAVLVRSGVLDVLPEGRTEQLQARIHRLGEEVDTRITLVAMNGEVLADSKLANVAQVAEMENHKDRLELVQAAARGHGASERTSPTLGEPMLYVAVRADNRGAPVGLVRLARPMTEVRAKVAAIRRLIWLVAALVSFAVVALTYFVAARVVRPIRTLTHAAEAISAGDYQQRVYLKTRDELGALAKSFNQMSGQLEAREAQLRESSQRLATVLEGMAEGVIALDAEPADLAGERGGGTTAPVFARRSGGASPAGSGAQPRTKAGSCRLTDGVRHAAR